MLATLYWRRFRCGACGRLFLLPLEDTTLPVHPRARTATDRCAGDDAVPA
jgi:hypothetical protein